MVARCQNPLKIIALFCLLANTIPISLLLSRLEVFKKWDEVILSVVFITVKLSEETRDCERGFFLETRACSGGVDENNLARALLVFIYIGADELDLI